MRKFFCILELSDGVVQSVIIRSNSDEEMNCKLQAYIDSHKEELGTVKHTKIYDMALADRI